MTSPTRSCGHWEQWSKKVYHKKSAEVVVVKIDGESHKERRTEQFVVFSLPEI